ncbi:DUF5403 family protein [Actinomadura sp. WMMB 499]|uniref:DUF5403 family protein n=1 Tax=Actinomadura sp. WMMB 499 TaxID=1219491 RepID=UPI0012446963|nr:DUF5403 family protein [Actinomadura sp. WMMB 499]QFG25449.1 hypothetical protein F7P10_34095 [Actinomadura sp. WMMB 499]
MAYVRNNLNEIVAELPGVQAAVRKQAYLLEFRIRTLIRPHSRTGFLLSSVGVERANDKDYWVYIGARYAAPVNFGFKHNRTEERIQGLHFIKGAIYG